MRLRIPIAFAVLAMGACATATAITPRVGTTSPPAGEDIDTSTVVALLPSVSGPCISVAFNDVVAVIARGPIEGRATDARATWKTEDERLALIAANRARALLAALRPGRDAFGCVRIARTQLGDSEFLVAAILEDGKAAVFGKGWAPRGESSITVRHVGSRCGPTCGSGRVLFHLRGRRAPFFSVLSWIA